MYSATRSKKRIKLSEENWYFDEKSGNGKKDEPQQCFDKSSNGGRTTDHFDNPLKKVNTPAVIHNEQKSIYPIELDTHKDKNKTEPSHNFAHESYPTKAFGAFSEKSTNIIWENIRVSSTNKKNEHMLPNQSIGACKIGCRDEEITKNESAMSPVIGRRKKKMSKMKRKYDVLLEGNENISQTITSGAYSDTSKIDNCLFGTKKAEVHPIIFKPNESKDKRNKFPQSESFRKINTNNQKMIKPNQNYVHAQSVRRNKSDSIFSKYENLIVPLRSDAKLKTAGNLQVDDKVISEVGSECRDDQIYQIPEKIGTKVDLTLNFTLDKGKNLETSRLGKNAAAYKKTLHKQNFNNILMSNFLVNENEANNSVGKQNYWDYKTGNSTDYSQDSSLLIDFVDTTDVIREQNFNELSEFSFDVPLNRKDLNAITKSEKMRQSGIVIELCDGLTLDDVSKASFDLDSSKQHNSNNTGNNGEEFVTYLAQHDENNRFRRIATCSEKNKTSCDDNLDDQTIRIFDLDNNTIVKSEWQKKNCSSVSQTINSFENEDVFEIGVQEESIDDNKLSVEITKILNFLNNEPVDMEDGEPKPIESLDENIQKLQDSFMSEFKENKYIDLTSSNNSQSCISNDAIEVIANSNHEFYFPEEKYFSQLTNTSFRNMEPEGQSLCFSKIEFLNLNERSSINSAKKKIPKDPIIKDGKLLLPKNLSNIISKPVLFCERNAQENTLQELCFSFQNINLNKDKKFVRDAKFTICSKKTDKKLENSAINASTKKISTRSGNLGLSSVAKNRKSTEKRKMGVTKNVANKSMDCNSSNKTLKTTAQKLKSRARKVKSSNVLTNEALEKIHLQFLEEIMSERGRTEDEESVISVGDYSVFSRAIKKSKAVKRTSSFTSSLCSTQLTNENKIDLLSKPNLTIEGATDNFERLSQCSTLLFSEEQIEEKLKNISHNISDQLSQGSIFSSSQKPIGEINQNMLTRNSIEANTNSAQQYPSSCIQEPIVKDFETSNVSTAEKSQSARNKSLLLKIPFGYTRKTRSSSIHYLNHPSSSSIRTLNSTQSQRSYNETGSQQEENEICDILCSQSSQSTCKSTTLANAFKDVSSFIKTSDQYIREMQLLVSPRKFNENSITLTGAFTGPDEFIRSVHIENKSFSSETPPSGVTSSVPVVEVVIRKNNNARCKLNSSIGKLYASLEEVANCKDVDEVHEVVNLKNGKDEVLARIRNIFFELSEDLENNRKLILKLPNFRLWTNTVFKNNRLMLKPKEETKFVQVKRDHKRSTPKFKLMLYLLRKVYTILMYGASCTKRELYYQIINFVKSQSLVVNSINAVCCMLEVAPWELGILASSNGLVYGDLKVTVDGEMINYGARGGTIIPADLRGLTKIETEAQFILIVEKDAIFQKLLDEGAPDKLAAKFILITGKGYPSVSTRLFIKKLSTYLKLPMFILVDADPYGIEIMFTYRFGCLSTCFLSNELALPNLKWLGVHPSEIHVLNINNVRLTPRDRSKVQHILKRPYIKPHKRIEEELLTVLKHNFKAEIEGLIKCNHSLSKFYLPNKLLTKDFI